MKIDFILIKFIKKYCLIVYNEQKLPEHSTAITSLAPALAANIDKIPVPQPTSNTILSLNRCLLCNIEFLYVIVLTSSVQKGKKKNEWNCFIKLLSNYLNQPLSISS